MPITNLYLIRHGEGMFAVHGRLADLRGEAAPARRWHLQRYNDHLHLRDGVRWGAAG